MREKELYQQKMQAQLNEWKAEIAKLKAKASGASADAQLDMHKKVKQLEREADELKNKLSELARSGEEAWASLRKGVESAWDHLKNEVQDAASKFKN